MLSNIIYNITHIKLICLFEMNVLAEGERPN